ncbi:MAG: Trk system potassium transporter TrkA [Gemmatimonadota bacterium]
MQILILGAGDIGFQLARRLIQDGHDVTMVEVDVRRARRVNEQLDVLMVEGSATSMRVLREANLERMDVVAAMTTSDEVNLLACQMAKKAGVKSCIARVRNPEFTMPDTLLSPAELGIDMVIHPERETADAIDRLIRQSRATDVIEFGEGRIHLLGVRLEDDSPLLRTSLEELFRKYNHPPVRITAIKRKQQTIIPGPRDVLIPGDQIFAVAAPEYLPTFVELTGQKDTRIENVMILGGGLIGQFVARDLHGEVDVKIIESNVERSWQIADRLPGILIIQGDGMDADLLATEGILDMDAFIAVTGDDESNIIATLLAQHLGVPRTVALVNKMEYLPIMPTIGLGAVVSKQLLTVNAVLRAVRARQVASIASVPGLDAEIIEYIAAPGSRITKKPLREAGFPQHAIIGAVMHGDQLVIPMGDTHIEAGDRAVVFALPHVIDSVEKFFRG